MAAMTTESRISRLEGAYEQIDERLGDLNDSVNSRLNTMTIAMVTVAVALVGLHVAQFVIR